MTRDSANHRADSRACYRTRDLPRTRAVFASTGFADTEAGAGANQRSRGGPVNGAPSKLALLSASAQKQRNGGNGRQQKRRYTRSNFHVPSHQSDLSRR
jgi:hypothetical protein